MPVYTLMERLAGTFSCVSFLPIITQKHDVLLVPVDLTIVYSATISHIATIMDHDGFSMGKKC